MAQRLKLPRIALSHIENGRRGLDALELKRLAGLYLYPVSYFTGEVNPGKGLEAALEPLLQTAADLFRHDREEVRHFAEYLRRAWSMMCPRRAERIAELAARCRRENCQCLFTPGSFSDHDHE